MGALLSASRAIDRVISGIGRAAAWILVPMMAVIVVDVITRKFGLLTGAREFFLDHGMNGAASLIEGYFTSTKFQELEWHLHGALFLLCLGFAYLKNSHVRIEIVRERFGLRTKAWLELTGIAIFLIPYCYLVFRFGLDFTHRSFAMGEVSSALTGLSHRWIIKMFVPIGMVLLFVGAVGVALRNIVFLFAPGALSEQARENAPELHQPEEELLGLGESAVIG